MHLVHNFCFLIDVDTDNISTDKYIFNVLNIS